MSHTNERTPIRDRWTARPAGDDDEAAAGAVLRGAAQHGPVAEKRLVQIHARLRRRKQPKSFARLRLLRLGLATAVVLSAGVLSAAIMRAARHISKPDSNRTTESPRTPPRPREGRATKTNASAETTAPSLRAPAPTEPSPTANPLAPPRSLSPHRRVASVEAPHVPATPDQASPAPSIDAPSPLAPPRSEPSRLAQESRWLGSALAQLRQDGQPEQALAILDEHQLALASGPLSAEANATRIEALLRLGRNAQALAILDEQRLLPQGAQRPLMIARAELRADKGRLSAAKLDFDALLSSPRRADAVTERALYGRAVCRIKTGDAEGARADFTQYVDIFPQGRFAREARSALEAQLR